MRSTIITVITICLIFSGISICQAKTQNHWQHNYQNGFNIAYWRGAGESGICVYTLETGAVWIGVKLPSEVQSIEIAKPFKIRVDRGKTFSPNGQILQPVATSACWQIVAPGEKIKQGSLIYRLMKGKYVSISCHLSDGQKFTTKIPLKGSGQAIKKLLANRP